MADELSELDELIESDVLEALGEKIAEDSSVEIDGITIEDVEQPVEETATDKTPEVEAIEETSDEIETDENPTPDESDEITIENLEEPQEDIVQEVSTPSNEKTINTSDLATLLSELLNNKTIEITIKVKD